MSATLVLLFFANITKVEALVTENDRYSQKNTFFMEVCSLRTRSHYCFITINDKRLVSFVLVISVEVQMQIQCIVLYLTYLT